jgi:DNA-binding MarR family transcriptional regulator
MEPDKFFELDDALCFALYTANRLMSQTYRPFLSDLGLTYPQFLVMISLWNKDEQSLNEIGEKLLLDSGTLTPLVKRLISQKFVSKVRSEDDERKVVVALTDKGRELKTKAAHIPEGMFCKLNMSMPEFVKLRDEVKTLISNLKAKEH